MKYIIVGLGNFGANLAEKLTAQGHEVIGIDSRMEKVDSLKEKITHTICMDATDEDTVAGLPTQDADIVVVAIGENQGSNIMITAIFKNLGVKRLVSRAINPLQEKVLKAIGVDEIVHPELEASERWAKKLCLQNVVDSFDLSEDYSIIEAKAAPVHVGKTLAEIGFRSKFRILVLTTIRKTEITSKIGRGESVNKVQGVATPDLVIADGDILVLYGANKDLQDFLKLKRGNLF